MNITQRSVAAWAMSLCHSCDVNVESPKAVKGVYSVVLLAEQERAKDPVAAKLYKIDEQWAEWMGNKIAEISGNQTDRPVTDLHRDNMKKHARRALKTISKDDFYKRALHMAVAFDLIPCPPGMKVT
jgi:hypothetical protein